MKRWNTTGSLSITIEIVNNDWQSPELGDQFGDILPQELSNELVSYAFESQPESDDPYKVVITGLDIEFKSAGYNDPGVKTGGPQGVGWAPENDDERTLASVMLRTKGKPNGIPLPRDLAEAVFGFYYDRIQSIEIDVDNDDVLDIARHMNYD